MSTSTPNFHFTKPAASDNVNIADLNGNFDIIDSGVEPVHAYTTATGSNSSITISGALPGPLMVFTAVGMGTPQVFTIEGEIGSEMGQQTWVAPMILDVPLGIINANAEPLIVSYGSGVGANTWAPTQGTEFGTSMYFNSKEVVALFEAAADSGGVVTDEGSGFRLYACPLPFSVAENSVVYCSHLQNRNVSGEEGIWASGSTLYLRIADNHSGGDDFGKLASRIEKIASNCNYYNPMAPVGFEPDNFYDFFIFVTASAIYTKEDGRKFAVTLGNGTHTLLYLKISDYIALISEESPDPTPISAMTAAYYRDTEVNRMTTANIDLAIMQKFDGPAALGREAVAVNGGAVGIGATETYGGGAVGYQAKAATGGAVGVNASSISGQGGAVGMNAVAYDGGAVGYAAKTSQGCAIGRNAECKDSHGDPIDAVQLGTGTNSNYRSMKVYETELLTYNNGNRYIPLSLITSSYSYSSQSDQDSFAAAIGIADVAQKSNSNGGGELGTNASATMGGAIGNGATATTGFAGGLNATETGGGGAVGYNTRATDGGAIGSGATATTGFAGGNAATETRGGVAVGNGAATSWGGSAVGASASASSGGAVGNGASAGSGGAVGNGASAGSGGAVGEGAKEEYGGAAVGYNAQTTDGVAIGREAKCGYNHQGEFFPISAIQIGTGTNQETYSVQVYSTKILKPTTSGSNASLVIPLSLITASYNAASAADQAAFKAALGIS